MTGTDRPLTPTEDRFQESLLDWGRSNTRDFPWREPNRSLYEVFLAEFFLTQTPAENVASVYPRFLERFPSLNSIDKAEKDELIEIIEPLGFYNMRANALKKIASRVSHIPEEPDKLVELPRVGRYVANATVCFGLSEPLPILDRNVKRVYGRVFEESWPETENQQMDFAANLVPKAQPRLYNFSLLDFGAAICESSPNCTDCFATEYCQYYERLD